MPAGREKNLIRAARFTDANTCMRVPGPACAERFLTGGYLAALFRVTDLTVATRTIVRRGLPVSSQSGYELRQNGTAINFIVYGTPGGPSVTATWSRALTAADLDKWMLALCRCTLGASSQLTINGVNGTAASLAALTYVPPTASTSLFLGCSGVGGTQTAAGVYLAQVCLATNGAITSVTSPLAHFQSSQQARRLEELPHATLYIDYENYGGGGTPIVSPATTPTLTHFSDDVRGARVENIGTVPVPVTVRASNNNLLDWVTP